MRNDPRLQSIRRVLLDSAMHQPMYAGSGYGMVFETMLDMIEQGYFRRINVAGVTYAEITSKGKKARDE